MGPIEKDRSTKKRAMSFTSKLDRKEKSLLTQLYNDNVTNEYLYAIAKTRKEKQPTKILKRHVHKLTMTIYQLKNWTTRKSTSLTCHQFMNTSACIFFIQFKVCW